MLSLFFLSLSRYIPLKFLDKATTVSLQILTCSLWIIKLDVMLSGYLQCLRITHETKDSSNKDDGIV
jgi:hypothetical protein